MKKAQIKELEKKLHYTTMQRDAARRVNDEISGGIFCISTHHRDIEIEVNKHVKRADVAWDLVYEADELLEAVVESTDLTDAVALGVKINAYLTKRKEMDQL